MLRLEAARHFFAAAAVRAAAASAHDFFFRASRRHTYECESLQTYLAETTDVFSAVGVLAWRACDLANAWAMAVLRLAAVSVR